MGVFYGFSPHNPPNAFENEISLIRLTEASESNHFERAAETRVNLSDVRLFPRNVTFSRKNLAYAQQLRTIATRLSPPKPAA